MTERRALKLRCGTVGQVALFGALGMPKLSLFWRKRLQPQQHVHVRQGSLIRHGWTIGFNPKIVVLQNHHHVAAGATRIDQVFAVTGRGSFDLQSHRVTTKLMRETVFVDRHVVRKAEKSPNTDRNSHSRPTRRNTDLPMMQYRRKARPRLVPAEQQNSDLPQTVLASPRGRAYRKESALATVSPNAPAQNAAVSNRLAWARQRTGHPITVLSAEQRASRQNAAIFQSARVARLTPSPPPMRQNFAKAVDMAMPKNTNKRWAGAAQMGPLNRRPTAEQVWLKPTESQNRLVEISPDGEFAQPMVAKAPRAQIFAPAPSTVQTASQSPLPDMNRLVDEVIRRIDRVSRDERLRRGV